MQERAKRRWENNYTIFSGELTEEEQRYRDYFETDLKKNPEDEAIESKLDENQVLGMDIYKLDRYDFQESYTRTPEDDATSYLEKKAFKFRYRAAGDTYEDYLRRQDRVETRQGERFAKNKFHEIANKLGKAIEADDNGARVVFENQYLNIIAEDSVAQYRDYFESDKEEDWAFFEKATALDKSAFIRNFTDYQIPIGESKGYVSFPKRSWNNAFGVFKNLRLNHHDMRLIVPKAERLFNIELSAKRKIAAKSLAADNQTGLLSDRTE